MHIFNTIFATPPPPTPWKVYNSVDEETLSSSGGFTKFIGQLFANPKKPMMIPINGKFSDWRKKPANVALLVLIAACLWTEAARQIQDTRERIRFSEQLTNGLDELMTATDQIALSRASPGSVKVQSSTQILANQQKAVLEMDYAKDSAQPTHNVLTGNAISHFRAKASDMPIVSKRIK